MEKITRNKVETLRSVINRINFRTVSDRNVRRQLIGLVPQLERLVKERVADMQEIHKRIFGEFDTETLKAHDALVGEITNQKDKSEAERLDKERKEKFPDVIKALEVFHDELNYYGEQEVEVGVDALDAEAFIDGLSEQDFPIDAALLSALTPVVKM